MQPIARPLPPRGPRVSCLKPLAGVSVLGTLSLMLSACADGLPPDVEVPDGISPTSEYTPNPSPGETPTLAPPLSPDPSSAPEPTVTLDPTLEPTLEPPSPPDETDTPWSTPWSTETPTLEPTPTPSSPLRLNEVNCQGDDWIELYNAGTFPIVLEGWTLTDAAEDPGHRYTFRPGTAIDPAQFLVVPVDESGEKGIPFGLSCGRDVLQLLDPADVPQDAVTLPELPEGQTFGRLPDGEGDWVNTLPTLGASNQAAPYQPPVEDQCIPILSVDPSSSGIYTRPEGDLYLTEGDSLLLHLSCSGDYTFSSFALTGLELPPGASIDAETWTFAWTPSLSQAGRWELQFGISPLVAPYQQEVLEVDLSVADQYAAPDNVGVDPVLYQKEWGLPVLHLQPSTGVGDEYVPSVITYKGETFQAEMKLRGASSLGYPKNSYTLKFPEDQEIDLSKEGLGNKRRLVLISLFDDNSYVRQKLAYDVWQDMASFWARDRMTPRTFFVVVYLGGIYHGLYIAADHIDDEFLRQMELDKTGNLYKAVDHNANFYLTNAWGIPKSTLHDGYEKKEGTPAEGEEGAFDDLDALVNFSGSSRNSRFMSEVDSWLRRDEFMDWFLFVHYLSADDSGGKNAYLYNLPSAQEFRYCPWDMNHSFGQDWQTLRVSSSANNDFIAANGIFGHFETDVNASIELWGRFAALMEDGPFYHGYFVDRLQGYRAQIDPAAARDWQKWSDAYYGYWSYARPGTDWTDYEGEQQYLSDWLEERYDYMLTVHPG